MAKSIFSFLFSGSSSSSETGSKKDGKGNAELVSMGNEEAAQQIQLASEKGIVKGNDNKKPEKTVAQDEIKKYKAPKSTSSKTQTNKRAKKAVRTRTLEINDKTRHAKENVKDAHRATINKKAKVDTIKEFIDQLPNDTQNIIKDQIKRKVKNKEVEYDAEARPVEKTSTQKTKEQISKRELLERKRGIYREQQTALRLAKLAAEKARAMVKAVRERVLNKLRGKKPTTVQQQPNVQTQNQSKDMSKYLSNMRDNTK